MAMRVQTKSKKPSSSSRGANRAAATYGTDPYHDEGSDDENTISLAAIKKGFKKPPAGGAVSKCKDIFFFTYFTYKTFSFL